MTDIHRFKVDKLIRDKLPEIMQKEGTNACIRVMERDEYIARLKDKLFEESGEVATVSDNLEIMNELADLLEVMMALAEACGIPFSNVVAAGALKKAEKGGFDAKIYCEHVEVDESSPAISYYLAQPDKYLKLK
jgi:predicted house-cleaning noncanonical NTP pyrophosphatase (MazG superfamily)